VSEARFGQGLCGLSHSLHEELMRLCLLLWIALVCASLFLQIHSSSIRVMIVDNRSSQRVPTTSDDRSRFRHHRVRRDRFRKQDSNISPRSRKRLCRLPSGQQTVKLPGVAGEAPRDFLKEALTRFTCVDRDQENARAVRMAPTQTVSESAFGHY